MRKNLEKLQRRMRARQASRQRRGRPVKPATVPVAPAYVLRLAKAFALELMHRGHDTVFVRNCLRSAFPGLKRVRHELVDDVVAAWNRREDV